MRHFITRDLIINLVRILLHSTTSVSGGQFNKQQKGNTSTNYYML